MDAVVGAPPTEVDAFVRALLSTGDGRLAYFYDTMAHFDAPHLAFALGATPSQASALAASFAAIDPRWSIETHPFLRPPVDPTTVLLRVRLDAEGRLLGPRSRRFWIRALDADGPDVTPSEAAGILEGEEAMRRRSWIR